MGTPGQLNFLIGFTLFITADEKIAVRQKLKFNIGADDFSLVVGDVLTLLYFCQSYD